MAEPWRVTLMGGLRAERAGKTITRFKYQKVGGLLAYLAYNRKQMHAREVLVEIFWPENEPEAGRANLSVALSSLRNQFEPPGTPAGTVLRADRYSVGVHPGALTTDVAAFQEAVQAAARLPARASERAEYLARAVELYQGPLLPGFYEDWISAEQERLSGLFFDAVSALIALREEDGDLIEALRLARHAVSVDALREEAHQHLMRLLAASGQPGAALRQYRELERLLEEEMGEEPSAPLRTLARRIEKDTGLAVPPVSHHPAPTAPRHADRFGVPAGLPQTLTFLLTDIEGSTRLWEQAGDAFRAALETHHRLLRGLFAEHGGQELKETGDAFLVAFGSASKALTCAVAAQQELVRQAWLETAGPLKVRMVLHTGEVEREEDGEFRGLALHRASRILAAAHGGQILTGEAAASLLRAHLPAGVRLVDLGVFRLRDVPAPERLYQAEYPEMSSEPFPPPAAEPGHAGHLPLVFTRFFGREKEIVVLQEWLAPEQPLSRLVTLTGTGGTGKTRLAIAVAERLVGAYRGVVWFVPLADLSDPARIDDAILDTLRLPRSPQREPREQAIEFLSRQPGLLVLDNCEHLLAEPAAEPQNHPAPIENRQSPIINRPFQGGAQIVKDYLARVPSLVCLVTSRQLLGLTGEREFAVLPLPTPNGPDTPERLGLFDSVQLFIDRAQQAMPHFQVTTANAPAVAELCQRLEGIPLAIELAAARALVLTPAQMLAQLENRFELLSGRKKDMPERHRTLRAAVEWSYRLLSSELQRFFMRLSVFRGGWTVEAAEAVCEAPLALDYLAELRDGSLVLSEETAQGMRFRMLETLREYAGEQLAEAAEGTACRKRHAGYFLDLAEQTEQQLSGPEQATWLERLETEHDNLRAALEGCRTDEDGAENGLRLAGALGRFWEIRGHLNEGRSYLAEALSRKAIEERTTVRARALNGAGTLAMMQGDFMTAQTLHEQALAIRRDLGDMQGIATSLSNLGIMAFYQGDFVAAKTLFEEGLAVYRVLDDKQGIATSLNGLAILAHFQGDYAAAWMLHEQALAIRRDLGDMQGVATSLSNQGGVAQDQGDYEAARTLYEESLEVCSKLGHKSAIAGLLNNLGNVSYIQGDYEAARKLYEEALAINRDLGNRAWEAKNLVNLGDVARNQGDYARAQSLLKEGLAINREMKVKLDSAESLESCAALAAEQGGLERAARLSGAAEALREEIGTPLPPKEQEEYNRHVTEARKGFAAAWEAGRAMSYEEAVAYALSDDSD